MEPSNEIWNDPTAHKLKEVFENLRVGHGLLSHEQFIAAISSGDLEIWALPLGAYALIGWGTCEHGETCNILTVTGDAQAAGESGLRAIESIARKRGARMVITVARAGWKQLLERHGYETTPKVLAKKVLES
jgi:hypothetical protein